MPTVPPRRGWTPPRGDSKAMSKWNQDDAETYQANLQLASLAESCALHRNVTAARVALRTLDAMTQPDSVAYNCVLKALAKVSPAVVTGDTRASEVAESLLREMKHIHQSQRAANQEWYKQLSEGTLSDPELEQGPPRVRVKPNVRSYSTVIDALGRTGDREAAQRAEDLHNDLQRAYEATGDGALSPNLISYNTLLSAYANCGDAQRCLEIIRDMSPDIISHNTVLHALARSQVSPDKAGERAEAYFRKMVKRVPPNARSYSTCMDAWSRSGQPEQAYRLLQEMIKEYENSGRDPSLKPNTVTYSTVIHGYAISKDPQKAVRAFQVWQDMKNAGVKPNQVALNNVLNACATASPPTPIVRRILQTLYNHSLRHGKPDEVTFGIVLKALQNWMDESTISPSEVFAEARSRGVVSVGVLYHLRQTVSKETYRKLVGDHGDWADLPWEWRDKVKQVRKKGG